MKEKIFDTLEQWWNFLFPSGQRIDCRRIIPNFKKAQGKFIYLPFDVSMCCPVCGELAKPKGKCNLIFDYAVNVQLLVSCPCGCTHRPPILEDIKEKNKGMLLLHAYDQK